MTKSLRQGLDKSKGVIAEFKGMRRRRQIGVPAFAVILAVSVWTALERDVFEGILLIIAASGLLVGALNFAPNRPKLRVASISGANKAVVQREPVRPVNEEAIVGEQERSCREEMPRQPRPKFPAGHPLDDSAVRALADQLEQAHRLAGQPSDDSLREHLQVIRRYGFDLSEWLASYGKVRAEFLRAFECELRVYESGHASADHVDLILRFPAGFELDENYPEVFEQPKPPKFSYGFIGSHVSDLMLDIQRPLRQPGGIKLHRTDDEPRYSVENGCPRIDYSLGHINQAYYRAIPAFNLKAPKDPGEYTVTWELIAEGLPKVLTGTISLEFPTPPQGQPITALGDLEEEGRQIHLLG